MKYYCDLGHQGGSMTNYENESKKDFEARCYRISMFALKGSLKVKKL